MSQNRALLKRTFSPIPNNIILNEVKHLGKNFNRDLRMSRFFRAEALQNDGKWHQRCLFDTTSIHNYINEIN